MIETKFIEQKIHEIKSVIDINKNNLNEVGIMGGTAGVMLFYSNYYDYFNDNSCLNDINELIEKSFNTINNLNVSHGFGDGLSGFAWVLNYLNKRGLINKDSITSFFYEINDWVFKQSLYDIKTKNYDYLHGGMGALLHFIEIENHQEQKYIDNLITSLNKIKISKNEINYFIDYKYLIDDEEIANKEVINLGLAHGLPSLVVILSKCQKKVIDQKKITDLLSELISCISCFRMSSKLSLFPIASIYSNDSSRLAWCYGDLGIAAMYWIAGKSTNNKSWKTESINILSHASTRLNIEENGIMDASICHGTAGVSHIYNRMYYNTGIETFKDTANYWIKKTLEMCKYNDGLAGYKYYGGEDGWLNEIGLLEGVAGVGLVLLSNISKQRPSWDECLLLS